MQIVESCVKILEEAFDIINKMIPNIEAVDVNDSIKHINSIENKLSIKLPKALQKFYARYSENQSILTAFYILNDLDKLIIEDEFLILGYSNEYTERYGICINDLENECINVKVARCGDKSNWLDYEELSSFIINCVTFQAINLLEASVVLDAKEIILEEYFKPLYIIKNKDNKCISYISNTDNILAVYFTAENIIYFGSSTDEILNDFEEQAGIDFDWL